MFILESGFTTNSSIIVYIPLFIALGIASFFIIINLFFKIIRHNSKKNEENPDRLTNFNDIRYIAKEILLNNDERDFLWKICKTYQVKNIVSQMKNQVTIDALFKSIFSNDINEHKKALLFSIRNKIEQDKHNTTLISSTKNIQIGQKITYLDENHDRYTTEVLDNGPDGLVLIVPKNIYGNELRPEPLSKIMLSFETKNHVAYQLRTRIVRYQIRHQSEVVVSHTNNLEILHRRKQRRIPYKPSCIFSAVQVSSGGNGKNPSIQYTPMEHKYEGKMIDISSEGCCIQTNLAIKKQQYIYIELNLDDSSADSLFGLIVETTQNTQTNLNILHIEFVRMKLETRNKIYKLVYEYV